MTPGRTNLLEDTALGRLLGDAPILCVDVGVRGGFEADLLPIAFAVEAVGMEPDPTAFTALAASEGSPWKSLRHLPYAIAGTAGPRTLSIPRHNASASLLKHDPSFGVAFKKPQYFEIERQEPIETVTLGQALAAVGLGAPSYLKLDVEGLELEILEGAPEALASLLAVKVEVSFLPFRKGQPLAGDIDAFMRHRGFQLMDLLHPAHWRTESEIIHPQSGRGPIPYSRGQLVQGDFLYFRAPDAVGDREGRLKAAGLAAAYGFFDHALRLLEGGGVRLPDGITAVDAIGEASRRYGRSLWLQATTDHVRRIWTLGRSLRNLVG